MQNDRSNWFPYAFEDYFGRLRDLVALYPSAKILELGGGRTPSFTMAQMPGNISSYTVNDINANELELVSSEYDKACFDVTGDITSFAEQFDVVFSRQLIEHVKDGRKMHDNIISLLKPGGVAFHIAPTLYALPFVVNKLLPERISRQILYFFFPNRRSDHPKFEAYYSWCISNRRKLTYMLMKHGYDKVEISTFYGHDYYRRIPILLQLSRLVTNVVARRDWYLFGSYVHITAYKASAL